MPGLCSSEGRSLDLYRNETREISARACDGRARGIKKELVKRPSAEKIFFVRGFGGIDSFLRRFHSKIDDIEGYPDEI